MLRLAAMLAVITFAFPPSKRPLRGQLEAGPASAPGFAAPDTVWVVRGPEAWLAPSLGWDGTVATQLLLRPCAPPPVSIGDSLVVVVAFRDRLDGRHALACRTQAFSAQ